MSGHCAEGSHGTCPDTIEDTGACSCPCHLATTVTDERIGHSITDDLFG